MIPEFFFQHGFFVVSQCSAPFVCCSPSSKWRTSFETILEIDDERDLSEWPGHLGTVLQLLSRVRMVPFRKTYWLLRVIDRICFQPAATWGSSCALSFPKTMFNIFGSSCSFRVCLLFEQIDAGDIVTDVRIFHFISESILSSGYQYPRCGWIISFWRNCNFKSVNSNNTMSVWQTWFCDVENHSVSLSSMTPDHKTWSTDCALVGHRRVFRSPL